jgi:hypothetical protein
LKNTWPRTWLMLGCIALLILAWFVYWPGLSGGFLFDDFVNLNAIGATGPIDDWPTFWRYVTSGGADPTGRPLALLSFLLDARDWPAAPRPFLRTNVLIHLANTALLFALLRQMGSRLESRTNLASTGRADAAALLGAGLWALHPLFVSTTLYAVQREALLAGSFTLIGLLAWGHGLRLMQQRSRAGAAWMLGGIGGGTLLATLCKANGALLPLLALVLAATVYRDVATSRLAKRWNWVLLVLPGGLICMYVVSHLGQWSTPIPSRPWDIGQRVITEPRVLLDYLATLIVPRVLSTGVYNDNYAWSTDLLHPATTLPALLAVLALLMTGFAIRGRHPVIAASLLFFFVGHLLESTTIPLELYFEHRNYLPAMLLGWPLARSIVGSQWHVTVRVGIAAALLSLLAITTWQRASLWADQPRMAGLWAATNPSSSRALATQALFDMHGNRPALAMEILLPPWQRRPYDLQLALNYVSAACMTRGGVSPRVIDSVGATLRHANQGGQLVYRWLGNVLDVAQAGRCAGVGMDTVEQWTIAAMANTRLASIPGRQQELRSLLGRIALARGDAIGALRDFRQGLDAWPNPDAAAQQSAWLAEAGHAAEGLALLDHYAAIESRGERPRGLNMAHLHQWVLDYQGYWAHEFSELRRKMNEDLAAGAAS